MNSGIRNKRLRLNRIRLGKCVRCGKPNDDRAFKSCISCRSDMKITSRNYRSVVCQLSEAIEIGTNK